MDWNDTRAQVAWVLIMILFLIVLPVAAWLGW